MKLNKPLLYSANTQEFPGKVRLRFVTFTETIVDQKDPDFLNGTLELCDHNDPRVREFKEMN